MSREHAHTQSTYALAHVQHDLTDAYRVFVCETLWPKVTHTVQTTRELQHQNRVTE